MAGYQLAIDPRKESGSTDLDERTRRQVFGLDKVNLAYKPSTRNSEQDQVLQNILHALSSSSPTDAERAGQSLARMVSTDDSRANFLAHPSCAGALVRLMANLEAPDRFAAAASLTAIFHLSSDPLGRRRILDPQQFLGPRPPESVVESMFAGLGSALRSPNANMVIQAAGTLNCLLLSEVAFVRVVNLPESRFRELVTGLVEVVDMQLPSLDPVSHGTEALVALVNNPETRARILGAHNGILELALTALTSMLVNPNASQVARARDPAEGAQRVAAAASVLVALTQDTDGQVKVMTRHPNLTQLMDGLSTVISTGDTQSIWMAASVLRNLVSCSELCEWMMLRPQQQVWSLLAGVCVLLHSTDNAVARATALAMRSLSQQAPAKLLQLDPDILHNLLSGIRMCLNAGDEVTVEAAAASMNNLLGDPAAHDVLYKTKKDVEYLEEVATALCHVMHTRHHQCHKPAFQALAKLFRGVNGESLLSQWVLPTRDAPRAWYEVWTARQEEIPEAEIPDYLRGMVANMVQSMLIALNSDDIQVSGCVVELLCVWASIPEAGWQRLLNFEEQIVIRLLTGVVHLLHCQDARTIRNTVIALHCFCLDERGQAYLALMDPAAIRLFLQGLRVHSQRSTDHTAADVAERSLRALEEQGPACWRRWLSAVDLDAPIITYPNWERGDTGSTSTNLMTTNPPGKAASGFSLASESWMGSGAGLGLVPALPAEKTSEVAEAPTRVPVDDMGKFLSGPIKPHSVTDYNSVFAAWRKEDASGAGWRPR